ncbi:outer membrane protein (porin) [Caballeronia choica]|uniref:Outer membrane protein (Porin) n=1 Tax=Caballeronia choica TaxID=326476 RepID=A0A158IYN9_9BURK|nr:porin [Caballeronia choica]SAL61716.1 outer membrane protein (porin) [Caballeronia choica]
MNRRVFVLAATALACQAASAQSSVTLYGLISTGIVYANNQKGADKQGHSTWQFASGPMQTPRWGMKGVEDLGGGVKAIFTLENGYNVGNGTLSQGGREFGRQAFVGLSSDRFGAVTFGRQYDEAVTLCVFSSACQFAAYGAHIGDSDNVFDTFRINNAVQYKSIDYRGFQFEGLYGFSNKAGGFSDNNAYSAGAQYRNGPLSLGAAYLQVNNPNDVNNPNGAVVGDYGFSSPFITNPATSSGVSKQRMYGGGGAYVLGTASLSLLYTNARFDYLDNSRLTLQNFEASLTDYVRPDLMLGVAYIFTTGQYRPQETSPKWHQVNAGADYFLSKRTDLFLVGIYQKAAGDAQYAQIYTLSPSTTKTQVSAVIGLRHKW